MERVSGDNNNYQLPPRNSASRDFDRFIDTFCGDGHECNVPIGIMAAALRDSLDRLNDGHTKVAKRSSLDRLSGGHVMAAKRSSLDRLSGGHVMAAKRSSLDRLSGGHVMAAKRSSLDRLSGGHVMAAKRSSLDRLSGGLVMAAKRRVTDRVNGGLAAVEDGPSSVRGQLQSAPQQLQQQPSNYPWTLTRWPETDAQSDGDLYFVNDYDDDYGCLGCDSSAKATTSF